MSKYSINITPDWIETDLGDLIKLSEVVRWSSSKVETMDWGLFATLNNGHSYRVAVRATQAELIEIRDRFVLGVVGKA